MSDSKDLLTKIFHKRLVDYKQQPDANTWSKIEQQLSAGKQKSTMAIWRWAGVAASILVIIAAGFLYDFIDKPKETNTTAFNVKPEQPYPNKQELPQAALPIPEQITAGKQTSIANVFAKIAKTTTISNTEIYSPKAENIDKQPVDNISAEQQPIEPTPAKEEKDPNFQKKTQLEETTIMDNLWANNRSSSQQHRSMLALAIGNSGANPSDMINHSTSEKPVYNYDAIQYVSGKSQALLRSTVNYELTNIDYKMPLMTGLYFRKYFTPSFALESGLSYTYLSSREYYLSANAPSMTKDIKLHYLGIPVKGIWSVYNNNRFSCYFTGGGSMEKCISGKETVSTSDNSTSSTLSVPEFQFSVAGGIGVNYRLVGHLGIFIEPGASYFFDDGNEIKTIRKHAPFNFQLQGGLRMAW